MDNETNEQPTDGYFEKLIKEIQDDPSKAAKLRRELGLDMDSAN